MNIRTFIRPILLDNFPAYVPSIGWDGKSLKLDVGENLWTPDLKIDWNSVLKDIALYPDPFSTKLRTRLAQDIDVQPLWIAVGNGSDELIDLCCRLFLDPGDKMVDFTPTFPMYAFFAQLSGATVIRVPRQEDFQIDVKKAKAEMSRAKLAFVANPNNPTGTLISRDVIIELLSVGIPLVVDEAYCEFAEMSVVDLIGKYENLIVLRTFSKWAGIAGLRVGWMVANPTVVERILAIKAPYNVNAIAQAIATQIQDRKSTFLPSIQRLIRSRDWFQRTVETIPGFTATPSKASCVCISSEVFDMKKVVQKLQEGNIVVKMLADSVIPNSIRVSIAPKEQMRLVVSTLLAYAKENL